MKKELIRKLIEIGAINVNFDKQYTFASGLVSPIYCDNRKILSYVDVRRYVKIKLVKSIINNFENIDIIAGVSTSGIPFGLMIAEELNLPFIYVRSKPKGYGLDKLIEGDLKEGQRVLVIEDLITTGGSSYKVVEVLRGFGAKVLGVHAIFTYSFDESVKLFNDSNTKLVTLTDFYSLVEIYEEKREKLEAWHNSL